ncbi:MAG: hypothetical protein HY074_00760 [Deltaproteobacteria bacterium]|nr:hypothetical protein [Deltaproteobacteria bacterium]
MSNRQKIFSVMLLTAMSLLSRSSFADDAISNSCGILIGTAKAQAAKQADVAIGSMTVREYFDRNHAKLLAPAGLPKVAQLFLSKVQPQTLSLARDVVELRTANGAAHDKARDAEKSFRDLNDARDRLTNHFPHGSANQQAKDQASIKQLAADIAEADKKSIELGHAAYEIDLLVKASENQLYANINRANGNMPLEPIKTEVDYNSVALSFRICGNPASLPEEDAVSLFCAKIDLPSGKITYQNVFAHAYSGHRLLNDQTVTEIGAEEPAIARFNANTETAIRKSYEKRLLKSLPQLCQDIANGVKAVSTSTLAEGADVKATKGAVDAKNAVKTGHGAIQVN